MLRSVHLNMSGPFDPTATVASARTCRRAQIRSVNRAGQKQATVRPAPSPFPGAATVHGLVRRRFPADSGCRSARQTPALIVAVAQNSNADPLVALADGGIGNGYESAGFLIRRTTGLRPSRDVSSQTRKETQCRRFTSLNARGWRPLIQFKKFSIERIFREAPAGDRAIVRRSRYAPTLECAGNGAFSLKARGSSSVNACLRRNPPFRFANVGRALFSPPPRGSCCGVGLTEGGSSWMQRN